MMRLERMQREVIVLILMCCVLISGCIFNQNGGKGTLEVNSSPNGAAVFLDNGFRGNTPITIDDITLGSHLVELCYLGYENWSANVSITSDTTKLFIPLIPISTPTPTPTPVLDKYLYCIENVPGSHYYPQPNQCLYPDQTPRPTKTPIIDNYVYCTENFPGSHYYPQTNQCLYSGETPRPTPTPKPTLDIYKYCAENFPGSQYNFSTKQCEYPPTVVVTTQHSNILGGVNK